MGQQWKQVINALSQSDEVHLVNTSMRLSGPVDAYIYRGTIAFLQKGQSTDLFSIMILLSTSYCMVIVFINFVVFYKKTNKKTLTQIKWDKNNLLFYTLVLFLAHPK